MSITKVSALAQLHFDIFITAMYGGIGYWSEATSYHHDTRTESGILVDDITGFAATIISPEEDWDGEMTIDKLVIAKGYRLASTTWKDKLHWSSGERPPLVVGPNTDWDCDAGDADMIVQLGLFGDVVYG
jgi:hypothetical protein